MKKHALSNGADVVSLYNSIVYDSMGGGSEEKKEKIAAYFLRDVADFRAIKPAM